MLNRPWKAWLTLITLLSPESNLPGQIVRVLPQDTVGPALRSGLERFRDLAFAITAISQVILQKIAQCPLGPAILPRNAHVLRSLPVLLHMENPPILPGLQPRREDLLSHRGNLPLFKSRPVLSPPRLTRIVKNNAAKGRRGRHHGARRLGASCPWRICLTTVTYRSYSFLMGKFGLLRFAACQSLLASLKSWSSVTRHKCGQSGRRQSVDHKLTGVLLAGSYSCNSKPRAPKVVWGPRRGNPRLL